MIHVSQDAMLQAMVLSGLHALNDGVTWTPMVEAELRRMYERGDSYGLMAKRLNLTRNTVMSKCHRNRKRWNRPGSLRQVRRHRPNRPPRALPPPPEPAEAVAEGVLLEDLEKCACRFALGEMAGRFRFCAAPQKSGSPYCPTHHLRCYAPTTGEGS